ncbi:MAG TPA: S8 family serine peptidase [Chitinophagaceae bacterium]|nr:S8 family serine peptidase [Chitinophagaceae bacterium]
MAKPKRQKADALLNKIDPKLRMYSNCEQQINESRALQNANLFVDPKMKMKDIEVKEQNLIKPPPLSKENKKTQLKKKSENIFTNVFIELRSGNLVAARIRLTELNKLAANDDVVGIELPRTLKLSDPLVSDRYADQKQRLPFKKLKKQFPQKSNVLIGIIDVGGFDFAHPDFLKDGKTRFLRIWDQGSTFRKPPAKYNYGAEFFKKDLDKAIEESVKRNVPATQLEKQSITDIGSHATHVASIAAGNSGVFPEADIIGVSIALKKSDVDRRKSFYDASCLVHALEYLFQVAEELKKPISINISLGTNGHAHDGTDATSRFINSELSVPGRCICVAAGNAGQEKSLKENDYGYTMGRIHTSGKIEASGLSKDLFWTVVGNGISDMSENELELWYAPQDRISVKIKPPGGEWIGPIQPNQYIENQQLKDGAFLSVYNDLYHFSNGANYIGIYLTPNYKKPQIPVKAGKWQVRLMGEEIRNGEYHGWIERDDPRPLGAIGDRQVWNFPSFFAEESNIDASSISSLACANYVIAVGNCDAGKEKIHISSSQGPTRDNRKKPEVIAPGTDIVAAKGFAGPDDQWIAMGGTSMASPYVCGIAAWMLSIDKTLSASQIQGIIIRTSTPLPGADYHWKDDCGFGLINPEACLMEAKNIKTKKDLTNDH